MKQTKMRLLQFYYQISNLSQQYYYKLKIENKFQFLRNSKSKFMRTAVEIKPEYERYIAEVSRAGMVVSLNTAIFIKILCEAIKPKHILDLGSGFSSFIFRSYAATQNDVDVWSVDDSQEWLERTRIYLASRNLGTESLLLWSEFEQSDPKTFDLIFHDLGNMDLRQESLHYVMQLGEAGQGIVLLDDMHKAPYAEYVTKILRNYSCRRYDLRPYTMDEFGRYCWLVCDIRRSN